MSVKNNVLNIFAFLMMLCLSCAAAELVIRLKNSDQKNYNVEMWRYSRLLKVQSDDVRLGHEHRSNKSAKLQGVSIRLNEYGLRGPEIDLGGKKKKILFLGSSNTLGWGVPEEDTMTSVLQKELGDKAVVMNAGIGNYNAERYVSLFKKKLRALHPDVVVIHYFIRDAEVLPPGRNNFLLRNSQLAVLLYHLVQQQMNQTNTVDKLTRYYGAMYEKDAPGYQMMMRSFAELKRMSEEDGFEVLVAMTPEIHQMDPYPFHFVDQKMAQVAQGFGWQFVNLYEPLSSVPTKDLWAMPGDPHINAKGHHLMAETLKPYLEN